ncbi:E2F-associated phosphoprotein, putative [Plasmodium relictum]|uniref:E2F-associated phosphoprotein, putative n=1 Tax=Plasmodium relictum TaxID=85471 RepID=A0A1J1H508_PLARL|nr:E2F-associated phosphoprotein, putative [Plasmodium relictum]CRG98673.1 E2F-associated phosphoprotein, putative [Plasmodium relictum]
MNSRRVNNVINLLINEIKVKEHKENAKDLSKEKGVNVAKSFLNDNFSDEKILKSLSDKEKNNKQEIREKRKKENEEKVNEEKVNEEKVDKEINYDEDNISESEKKVLEFYDEKIDNYNEEYVNKKYRFCTKNCDSSLCCCGCFIPVCYQSQRHEHYVNQYRSLYAVNVKIDEEIILNEDEINSKNKKNTNDLDKGKEKNVKKNVNNSIITINEKKSKKERLLKYHAVFCINCNNHIAYYEIKEKVFHFFDVLPD